jgi:hypothetical protein
LANTESKEVQTLQFAIFGVLFTLSKERNEGVHLAYMKLILDFIQLFTLMVSPEFGWVVDEDLWCVGGRVVVLCVHAWVQYLSYFLVVLAFSQLGVLCNVSCFLSKVYAYPPT